MNNGWTDQIEESLKNILSKIENYKIIHKNMANKASKQYKLLTNLGIVISPIALILTINYNTKTTENISSSLTALSGMIMSIIKFGKYEDVIYSNKKASSSYEILELNITQQLSLPLQDRINAKIYCEIVTDKFQDLFSQSPLLPDKTINEKTTINPDHNTNISNRYLFHELKRLEDNI